jgi:hypothetical protein
VKSWEFDPCKDSDPLSCSTDGLTAHNVASLGSAGGMLFGNSATHDPTLSSADLQISAAAVRTIEIKLAVSGGTQEQLFFRTTQADPFSEGKSWKFALRRAAVRVENQRRGARQSPEPCEPCLQRPHDICRRKTVSDCE